MINPVLRVGVPIQCRILDVDVLVCRVEVDISDRCGLSCLSTFDAHAFEIGRDD